MTTPDIPHFLGAHIPQREDPALLRGEGKYTADIHLEGTLHMGASGRLTRARRWAAE